MRLFFAVTVPTEVTDRIVTESKKIPARSLRWVAPENLHFTLRFLGEVKGLPQDKIDYLPETLLERDKERRRLSSHCTTQAMSDASRSPKAPGPLGSPVFGSLRRCSSSVCHSEHTKRLPCQSYDKGTRVAPGTDLKSGTPNSQFYPAATPKEGRVGGLISVGQETALKYRSFLLTISGAGFFPDEERPRVFWVGTGEGSKKLIALADDLSSALDRTGFPTEDRSFLPHLTVARVNVGGLGSIPYQKLESWKARNFGSFPVNEFCLMESLLLPSGAVYRKVHSFLLEVLNGEQG